MQLTSLVIAIFVAGLTVYDIWTIVRRGYTTTVSWTLLTLAKKFPIISFALGVVMGHLFWVNEIPDRKCEQIEVVE